MRALSTGCLLRDATSHVSVRTARHCSQRSFQLREPTAALHSQLHRHILLAVLCDHVVGGVALLPGTGHIEMALACAQQLSADLAAASIRLEQAQIRRPLALMYRHASYVMSRSELVDTFLMNSSSSSTSTAHVSGRRPTVQVAAACGVGSQQNRTDRLDQTKVAIETGAWELEAACKLTLPVFFQCRPASVNFISTADVHGTLRRTDLGSKRTCLVTLLYEKNASRFRIAK